MARTETAVTPRYSFASTRDRVRAACSPFSTIDVEAHASAIAENVAAVRREAKRELRDHRLAERGR